MLPLAPTVTRTMTTMAIVVMATDQITDHMRPGMDTDHTDHMRRHLELDLDGHLRVQHGVPGGGDCHLHKTLIRYVLMTCPGCLRGRRRFTSGSAF